MPRNTMSLVLENPNIPADIRVPREEDVARMIQVIEADALLVAGELVCAAAGHCAMGALLFAAGMTNEELATEKGSPGCFTARAAQKLYDFYRLDSGIAVNVVGVNDWMVHRRCDSFDVIDYSLEDLDQSLLELGAAQLCVPSEKEINSRKKAVVNTLIDETTRQRSENWPSLWPQLHFFEYRKRIEAIYDRDLAF